MIGRREDSTGTSAAPFVAALVIIVLVVIGIWLVNISRGGSDDQHTAVVRAVLAQNDALQRQDYADFRAVTCAQYGGDEATVLARQRESVAAKGARFVENITEVAIDGGRATANVVYYFENDKDTKVDSATALVLEDGVWRVCSPVAG